MAQTHAQNGNKRPKTVKVLMFNVSLDNANFWFDMSNLALLLGAVLVVVGTYGVYKMGAIKEHFSDLRISENERATAEANERAVHLEKEAAEARLETERLKKEVAWRDLNPITRGKLIAELSDKPARITLVFVSGDPEATRYCAQFVDVFRQAKWKVEVIGRTFLGPPIGIFVTQNDKWNSNIQSEIESVRKAFLDAGIPVGKGGGAVEARVPGLSLGTTDANVRIVVGHRPQPEIK